MTARDWLMRQNPARRPHAGIPQASEGFAALADAVAAEHFSAPVAAMRAEPVPDPPQRFTEAAVTSAVIPTLRTASADAAARTALHGELEHRKLRDGLERCGCWPRYIGGCYCPKDGG